MLQREVLLGQLLETQDVCALGSVSLPGPFLDERRSDLYHQKLRFLPNQWCTEFSFSSVPSQIRCLGARLSVHS